MQNARILNTINKNLRMFGYKIEVMDNKTVVKLPLFCSVNIIQDGEMLRTEPKFGFLSRTSATWLIQTMLLVEIALISFLVSDVRLSVLFGVLTVCAGIWDVYRYILTEHLITRVELWAIGIQNEVMHN